MAVAASGSAAEKFAFAVGDVVLVQWSDDRLYYAKLRRIDHATRTCSIVFEDNSRGDAKFSQIHSVDASTNDTTWIGCVICKIGTSEAPNEIVLCDECGVAFHQHCHDPVIPYRATQPEVPWRCWYCDTGTENPHMDLPDEDPFKEKGPVAREQPNSMSRKRMIKPTPTEKTLPSQQQPRPLTSFSIAQARIRKHGVHQVPMIAAGWSPASLPAGTAAGNVYQHSTRKPKGNTELPTSEVARPVSTAVVRCAPQNVSNIPVASPMTAGVKKSSPRTSQQPLKMKFSIAGKTAKVSSGDGRQNGKTSDKKKRVVKPVPIVYGSVGQYPLVAQQQIQYNYQHFDLSNPTVRTMTVKSRSPSGKSAKKMLPVVAPAEQYIVTTASGEQHVNGHPSAAEQMRPIAGLSPANHQSADGKRVTSSALQPAAMSSKSRFRPLQPKPTPLSSSPTATPPSRPLLSAPRGLSPSRKPLSTPSGLSKASTKPPTHSKRRHSSETSGAPHSKKKRSSPGRKPPSKSNLGGVDLRDCQRSSTVQTVTLSRDQLLYNQRNHRHGDDQSGIKLKIVNTFIVPPQGCSFTPDHVTAVGHGNSGPKTPMHVTQPTTAGRYFRPQVLVSEGERWTPAQADPVVASSHSTPAQPGTAVQAEQMSYQSDFEKQFSGLPPCCRVTLFPEGLPDYLTPRSTDTTALPEMGIHELQMQFDSLFGNLVADVRPRLPATANLPLPSESCPPGDGDDRDSQLIIDTEANSSQQADNQEGLVEKDDCPASPEGSTNPAESKPAQSADSPDVEVMIEIKKENETDGYEVASMECRKEAKKVNEDKPTIVIGLDDVVISVEPEKELELDPRDSPVRSNIPSTDVLSLSDQELTNQSPVEDISLELIESRDVTPVVSPVVLSTPVSPEDVILLDDDEDSPTKKKSFPVQN